MTWLNRLRRAWPNVVWDQDRVDGYIDALAGTEERHVDATLNNLLRGGWHDRYPPPASTLRYMVDEVRREEAAERGRHQQRLDRDDGHIVAGPWHAHLWRTWLTLSLGGTVHPDDHGYQEIITRHNLTPEDAGVRWTKGPDIHLVTVPELEQPAYREAIAEAEQVWRATGSTETAEQAAKRALGAMTGTTRLRGAPDPTPGAA